MHRLVKLLLRCQSKLKKPLLRSQTSDPKSDFDVNILCDESYSQRAHFQTL